MPAQPAIAGGRTFQGPGGGASEGPWVWRHYCSPVSFEVVEGEHWVIWTMHCYLPYTGGFGDADGYGVITGGAIEGVVPEAPEAGASQSGLYEVEITGTGTLTFTPFGTYGGSADSVVLLAHRISDAALDYQDCE